MDLRERIASLMSQVRPELAELVAIRSVADPRQFPPEACARARLNLRVPPGTPAGDAARALVSHLRAVAPWGCT